LETLIKLVQQCDNLQVDLETESKQLRSIVSESIEWIETSTDILQALQIPIVSIPRVSRNEEIEVTPDLSEAVSYGDLKKLFDSANHLSVQFPELRFVLLQISLNFL
jgi:hypothetical protein